MKAILSNGVQERMVYKSTKGVNPWDVDGNPNAWVGDKKEGDVAQLTPTVFAAIQARCKALSDMPFSIYNKKGDPVDDSDDYNNKLQFLPNPRNFLWMTEASLCTYGQAYWLKNINKFDITKDLQYFFPEAIEPKITEEGIVQFKRQIGTKAQYYKPEQLLYFYLPDPAVEIGPPTVWPLQSARISATAIGKINEFVKDYMERGAVKAMLLAAKDMPDPNEADRVERWFNKFMRGVNNLRWKVFSADVITPTIVGEGLEAFKGISVIDDMIQQINTAFGTRQLMEDENYATANIRQREFYEATIVPEARFIEDALNDQFLLEQGYRWEFEPERMEIFSDDNLNNMVAFGELAGTINGIDPSVIEFAFSLLGLSLSEEQEKMLVEIKKNKEESKQQQQDKIDQNTIDNASTDIPNFKMEEDLDKWMRKAAKKIGKDVNFVSEFIPDSEQERIHRMLVKCKDESDLKSVFFPEDMTEAPIYERPDYSDLITAMRIEVEGIKAVPRQADVKVYNYVQPAEPAKVENSFTLPEMKPEIKVDAPVVNIENKQDTPDIVVNVPEQKPPVVNVNTPKVKKSVQKVKRDPVSREIVSTETNNEYEE